MGSDKYGPVVGSCEHNNEYLGSIKGGVFPISDQLSEYTLLDSQEGL